MSSVVIATLYIYLFSFGMYVQKKMLVRVDNTQKKLSMILFSLLLLLSFILSLDYIPGRKAFILALLFSFISLVMVHRRKGLIIDVIPDKLSVFLALLPLVIFCIIMSIHSMPVAEGWYSYYAKLINEYGQVPYKDFELLFMPVYTYIITIFTKIFGYKIIALRIFGIFIYASIAVVTFFLFSEAFGKKTAVVSTIVACLFMQSEVVQIFYDYIRVFDLLTYISTLSLFVFCKKWFDGKSRKRYLCLVVSALSAITAFGIRQNSGAFVIAYSVLFICFVGCYKNEIKKMFIYAGTYLACVLIPFMIVLFIMFKNGCLDIFLNSTVNSALEAKGGLLTVLFAWIPRFFSSMLSCYVEIGFFIILLTINIILYFHYRVKEEKQVNYRISCLFSVLVIAGIGLVYFFNSLSSSFCSLYIDNLPVASFAVCCLLFLMCFVLLLAQKFNIKNIHFSESTIALFFNVMFISGMVIAIGYGSGTSAGLSEGQTALAVGLLVALLLYFSDHLFGRTSQTIIFLFCYILSLSIISKKFILPYSWWGLTEASVQESNTEITDIDELEGLLLSESTADGIERITKAIKDNSNENDTIFVFPQIPIFYVLSDRTSDTYTKVQWFDVSNYDSIIKDIEVLSDTLPKVIVHMKVDSYIVKSHEGLFNGGKVSGLSVMDEFLNTLEYGNYELIDSLVLQDYPVSVYVRVD